MNTVYSIFNFPSHLSELILIVFSTAVLPLMLWIKSKVIPILWLESEIFPAGKTTWKRTICKWCLWTPRGKHGKIKCGSALNNGVYKKAFYIFLFSLTPKQFHVKTDTYCWLNANGSVLMHILFSQTIFYR